MPGLTDHEEGGADRASPGSPDVGPRRQQPVPGLVPADQPGLAVPLRLEAGRRVARPLDGEDLDRAADALQPALAERLHVEVGVDELAGDVADHDRVRLGRLLDPRGEVRHQADDRVPLGDRPVRAEVGDHHPPGVDADPDLGGHAEPAVQLGACVLHRHHEVEAGEHGAPGVVLVGLGIAEGGEDAVAEVLHHVAAVAAHRVAGQPPGRRRRGPGAARAPRARTASSSRPGRRTAGVMRARSPDGPRWRVATCRRMRAARRLSGSTARTSSAVMRAGSRSPAASEVSAAVSSRSRRRVSLRLGRGREGGHRGHARVARET